MSPLRSPAQIRAEQDKEMEEFPLRHRMADQALADRYAMLSKKIGEAEDYFGSLRLPDSIHVNYNHVEGDPTPLDDVWESLAFVKYNGKWRLCYAFIHEETRDIVNGPDWKPLVDCATDIRLEAVGKLRELKVEALNCKEEYAQKVDEALSEIDKVISS